MPQLDPTYYASQLFWLIICFFSMMFIMSRFILPKIHDIRQQRFDKIDGNLRKAQAIKQQTETALAKYETALQEASRKAQTSLNKTRNELTEIIAAKQKELDVKLQQKISEGEAEIQKNKEKTLKDIQKISETAASEILKKLNIDTIKSADIAAIIRNEVK